MSHLHNYEHEDGRLFFVLSSQNTRLELRRRGRHWDFRVFLESFGIDEGSGLATSQDVCVMSVDVLDFDPSKVGAEDS